MSSDRFKVIKKQFLPLPGICNACGSDQRDCVDFGIDIEFVGAFMLCTECVNDLGNVDELNFVHRDKYDAVVLDNMALSAKYQEAVNGLSELRVNVVASLDAYTSDIEHAALSGLAGIPAPEESEQAGIGLDQAPVGYFGDTGSDVLSGSSSGPDSSGTV